MRINKIVENLDLRIDCTIENSKNQQFWVRFSSALALTIFLGCLGTSFQKSMFVILVGSLLMVTLANFIIIISVCKIQSTINKLKLVFLHERYADIHLIAFCLYYLIFAVQEMVNLVSQLMRE